MSELTDFSNCNNLTVNNNLVVGSDIISNNLIASNLTSTNLNVENIILNSQNVNDRLLTSENDIKVLESSVTDLSSTKADITYVQNSLSSLVGSAGPLYDTLGEIQAILQADDASLEALMTAVGLRALDANTVHKSTNGEIITGSKQFDGTIILNSNLKSNNIDLTPLEISRISGITGNCQQQLDTHTTGLANVQPQQTSISSTTILNDNYRSNCWFVITSATSINITLPNPNNNIGKIFWFTNQSPSACNLIGNGSNTIKIESNVGVWSSLASISIPANATLSLCCKSGGYVILYNSYIVSQLNSSTNTSVSALQTKTSLLTSNGSNFVVTKNTIGPDNASVLAIIDNPSSSSRNLSVFPNIASKTYTSLVEQSDTLLLSSQILTIAPNTSSSKSLGLRMTQDDLILSSSTSAVTDNKIVMNATNKTMNFVSPNWFGFNNAVSTTDVILNSYSLTQTLANIIANAQMISYDNSDQSTVLSKSGSTNRATLKICDDSGKALYFLPNATDNAYNYLTEANDSVIAYSNALSIVPYINSTNGIRMTQSVVKIGSTSSQPQYGLDNGIIFDGTARTITFNSPNWITANQALFAPDFYLSGTNESISNIIGNLRNADTTETTNRINGDNILADQYTSAFNSISVHTDLIGALQTKTQKITCNGTETHFSSNVVVDNNASVVITRTGNTPMLYNDTKPLYVVKAMVSFYMSSSGPQIMTGASSVGCSITRNSTGVYFLTLPLAIRQTLTTFTASNLTFYSCSAQINIGDSSLLSGWTAKTNGDAGNGVIAIFVRGGGSSPNLTDLPNFASNLCTFVTVFCY
jgi:hypothetical protein